MKKLEASKGRIPQGFLLSSRLPVVWLFYGSRNTAVMGLYLGPLRLYPWFRDPLNDTLREYDIRAGSGGMEAPAITSFL